MQLFYRSRKQNPYAIIPLGMSEWRHGNGGAGAWLDMAGGKPICTKGHYGLGSRVCSAAVGGQCRNVDHIPGVPSCQFFRM
jgi:hypothetical protein